MGFHFPLPKLRTTGDEITRSLAKSSHFSNSFPLHTSRLSLRHCGAENRNEITLSVAKKFRPLSRFRLSNGASRATSDREPKTIDQILLSPIEKKRLCVRWLGVINLT